jgi:hypothetical protein
MRITERRLRRRAFLAHYLKARETLEANGVTFSPNDPWLIQMAQKGVWGTQFLYNNAARPAIARTSLGRVFSRFQVWTLNSVRMQKNIARDAMLYGYPGSAEQAKFERMMQASLFMYAMTAMLPFSMFEATLPSPWNWAEDFHDFFFGDEEERQKAFYGVLPYPFNPLQTVTPPMGRYAIAPFISALSGDWDRFASYHVWSMIPFGLAVRPAYMTLQDPTMAVQAFTNVPLHRMGREQKALVEADRPRRGLVYIGGERDQDTL